ncbi:MAG: ubiquinone/menaquinone biosynthesis methyltransferase [Desulfovibrio sp.]|nr:ubiquinone/menaquinone biosynthesis methyltransferase [Desulfovibrio sp.]
MFGKIAGVYDLLNHLLSFGIDRYWRRELVALAFWDKKSPIFDLATGTLDVAVALHNRFPEAIVAGIDFCPEMLREGLPKLKKAEIENRVFPCAGDALAIPAKNESCSSLTMAFGIRNIPDRGRAFREMLRVLVPGGRACILEFSSGQERVWGGIYNFYLDKILPRVGRLVSRDKGAYSYLAETIRLFPSADKMARELDEAGFEKVGYRKLTSGVVCLHWGEKPKRQV